MKKVSIAAMSIILLIIFTGCSEVSPQEGGVRTNFIGIGQGFGQSGWFKQGIVNKPLQPGLYLHIPHLSTVDKYPVNELRYNMFKESPTGRDDVAFKTKDGQTAWIDITVRYQIIFDHLPILHREYGKQYVDNVIRPTIRSLVNNKLGEYSAEQIYDGKTRQAVAMEVRNMVNNGTDDQKGTIEQGIKITELLLRRFEFSDEYQAAIEQKRIAAEQHLAAVEWAKKREAEATGEKLATIQKAEGEATRVKMEADAELYSKLKEAEGIEAMGRANGQAQQALADALGGGDLVVQLEFARHLSESFQVWGVPTGENSSSIMDLSGVLGSMFPKTAGGSGAASGK